MQQVKKIAMKKAIKNLAVWAIFGALFLSFVFMLEHKDTTTSITNIEQVIKDDRIHAPQIVWNNRTLEDSTQYDPSSNTCYASKLGMIINIAPCVAQDVDHKDITQYVNFTWNGTQPQNTSWVFVYDGQLIDGEMNLMGNVSSTQSITVSQWITNYLVDNVVNYTNLGTPNTNCQFGNSNNTQMYSVNRKNINNTIYNEVYCFTTIQTVNSTAFRVSGNIDQNQNVNVNIPGWIDITNSISFMGVGLLQDNRSYYNVQNVVFNPNDTKATQWIYTPFGKASRGKWHILGYNADVGLINSLTSGQYIYIDPWWSASWTKKQQITNITSHYIIINVTKDNDMKSDYSDLRFIDNTETQELPYWIENYTANSATVRVNAMNKTTIYMYYGNAGATSNSNVNNVYPLNMTALYTFDFLANGSALTDEATGKSNFTNGGSIGFVPGKIGQASNFAGSQWWQNANLTDWQFGTGEFSFTFWLKTTDTNFEFYCNRQDGSASGTGTLVFPNGNNGGGVGQWGFYKTTTGTIIAGTLVNTGNWVFQTFTKSGTNLKSYQNNTLDKSGTIDNNNYGTNAFDSQIGGCDNSGSYTGLYDEIMVYKRALNPTEINDLYNSTQNTVIFGAEQANTGVSTTLQNPANNLISNNANVLFQVNSSLVGPITLSNVTLYVWNSANTLVYQNTVALSGNLTITTNWSRTLTDDVYTWYAQTYGSDVSTDVSQNRTLTIDTTAPTITINSPTNQTYLSFTSTYNITLNVSTSDIRPNSCWYFTSDSAVNQSVTCNVTSNLMFSSGGDKYVKYYVNDTAGNVNYSTVQFHITMLTVSVTVNKNPIGEGDYNQLGFCVNSSDALPDTSAYLTWNGTNLGIGALTLLTSKTICFSNNFVVPTGIGAINGRAVNYTWNFNITGFPANNYSSTQTVNSVAIDNCSTYTYNILNYTLKDEDSQSIASSTNTTRLIEADVKLSSWYNSSVYWQYFISQNNVSNLKVCVPASLLNNNSNYRLDVTNRFSFDDHVIEFEYLQAYNQSNNSNPQNIDLMDLATINSQSFQTTFYGCSYLPVDNAIIRTYRYYVGNGNYKEVEGSKTDQNGQTVTHLVLEDVVYKFYVWKEGQLLLVTPEYQATCQSSLCQFNLRQQCDTGGVTFDYTQIDNLWYRPYNVSSDYFVDFATSDGTNTVMNVTLLTQNGTLVCSTQVNNNYGQLNCSVAPSFYNQTLVANIYHNGVLIKSSPYEFLISAIESGIDTGTSIFFSIITVVAFVGMSISSGIGVVVWATVSLIFASLLWFSIPYSVLIYLIVAGAIIIFKIIKKGGR